MEGKWNEKLKTMFTQNFVVTNKEHYGMLWYFWSGQLNSADLKRTGAHIQVIFDK